MAKELKVKPTKGIFVFHLATSCTSSDQVIHDTGWVCLPRQALESLSRQYPDFSYRFCFGLWE